jgi:hypothetical protein
MRTQSSLRKENEIGEEKIKGSKNNKMNETINGNEPIYLGLLFPSAYFLKRL